MSAAKNLHTRGRQLEASGDYAQALEFYRAALVADPEFVPAHVAIQYIDHTPLNMLSELISFYEELAGHHTLKCRNLIWNILGYLHSDAGDTDRAIAALHQASQITLQKKGLPASIRATAEPSLPDFIIAGFSKCGTTSLYLYLRKHAQIIVGPKKEISFFNRYYHLGLEWYTTQMLRPRLGTFLTGEATPQYVCERGVELRVASLPHIPKVIILRRDPAHRAVSHYYQRRKSGLESRTLADAFTWEMNIVETKGLDAMARFGVSYVNRSLYRYHLLRWTEVIPQDNLLIVESEDFFNTPTTVLATVCRFLGVPALELDSYPAWNKGNYGCPPQSLVSELRHFFSKHDQR